MRGERSDVLFSTVAKRPLPLLLVAGPLAFIVSIVIIYFYAGTYGLNVVLRRGGSIWISIKPDDLRVSPSMRLALGDPPPTATAGVLEWRQTAEGFEIAELPVIADGIEVDRIMLARIESARFRFQVRNAPAGNREPADWMEELGAVLVINGSYFSRYGTPDTPIMSAGVVSGPPNYDAKHGAFISSPSFAGLRDLAQTSWMDAFRNADNAMVSYPLLIAADGTSRAKSDSRWLANRSFVGQDFDGRIVFGTTVDAFFSLDRLAAFLKASPVRLKLALNLDGGPVACQAIRLKNYRRDLCGKWETAVHDGKLQLLTSLLGNRRWGLPIVLAVVQK
jgi:hypothetical protein